VAHEIDTPDRPVRVAAGSGRHPVDTGPQMKVVELIRVLEEDGWRFARTQGDA
jgi:hypothetical protein